jgi:hypothetical protein
MKRRRIAAAAGLTALGALGGFAVKALADGIPSPTPLSYSGTLTENGQLVNGTRAITINVWPDATTTGTPLCQTVASTANVVSGRFRVPLVSNCKSVINQNNNAYVEVIDGATSLGRALVGAVPYAVEADHAVAATYAADAGFATSAGNAATANGASESFVVPAQLAVGGNATFGEDASAGATLTITGGPVVDEIAGEVGGAVALVNPTKGDAGIARTWKLYNMTGNYGNSLQFWEYDSTGCTPGGLCRGAMTLSDTGNLSVGGTVTATGFPTSSDAALKTNVRPLESPLDKIARLRGVRFNWKKDGKESIGVVAQEVEGVYPELVSAGPDGRKAVEYDKFAAVLIEAVKELDARVAGLEKKNAELSARLDRRR